MRTKRGNLLNGAVIHIIIIAIIFILFFSAVNGGTTTRGVKQQVLEKQTALLIDAAVPGMDLVIQKKNLNGIIQMVELEEGRVRIAVEGLNSLRGYPYLSKYSLQVIEEEAHFSIQVR